MFDITGITWRQMYDAATPAMQNASKRAAIERLLLAHPDWSNSRIARAIRVLIITDDDLDLPVEAGDAPPPKTGGLSPGMVARLAAILKGQHDKSDESSPLSVGASAAEVKSAEEILPIAISVRRRHFQDDDILALCDWVIVAALDMLRQSGRPRLLSIETIIDLYDTVRAPARSAA